MDIALLTTFLSPFLPHLLKLGGTATAKITETVSEKFGEASWTQAQKIWTKLHPKIEEKESLRVATKEFAQEHNDSSIWKPVFEAKLKELLDENPELAKAIAQIMAEEESRNPAGTQITQTVTGDGNQTIGIVSGGTVVGNVTGNVSL